MYTIKTFNSIAINDGTNYKSSFADDKGFLTSTSAKPVVIQQANDDPIDSGAFTVSERSFLLLIEIPTHSNTLAASLRSNLKRGTSGNLVVTFADDGFDYQIACIVMGFTPSDIYAGVYIIAMQTTSTTWRRVTGVTGQIVLESPATSASTTLTVPGYASSRLSATFTALANPTSGYLYQKLYLLPGVPGTTFGNSYPHRVVLDTHTLYQAGKVMQDCCDLRVFIDGVETRRWVADADTATTKIWFNVSMPAGAQGQEMYGGIQEGDNNIRLILDNFGAWAFPPNGYLMCETEIIRYKNARHSPGSLGEMNIIQRGCFGTTVTGHALGSWYYYLPHVIKIVYGNSSLTDPTLSSNYNISKPIFDLSASTNSSWVYTSITGFRDATAALRTGGWKPSIVGGTPPAHLCNFYDLKKEDGTTPVMGMQYRRFSGNATNMSSAIRWTLSHPAGILTITATGHKRRSAACFVSSQTFMYVWSKCSGGAQGAANTDVAMPTTGQYVNWSITNKSTVLSVLWKTMSIDFLLNCWTAPYVGNPYFEYEVHSATVTFVSTAVPTGTILSEKSNMYLSLQLANTTTGQYFKVTYPMVVGIPIVVDGENYAITYSGSSQYNAVELDNDSRSVWLPLNPGSNVITLTGTGVGKVQCDLSFYARRV